MRIEPITRLTRDAVRLIKQLDKKCFAGHSVNHPRLAKWWVIWDVDKPVAYTGVSFMRGGYAFMRRTGVLPEYRGRGFQRWLTDIRILAARQHGCNRVVGYTYHGATASMRNMIACGFLPRPMPRGSNRQECRDLTCWEKKL